MGFTNRPRQTFFGFRSGNEMNMVRHKAISPYLNLIFATPRTSSIESAAGIFKEYFGKNVS
jgi:hypothetical protein